MTTLPTAGVGIAAQGDVALATPTTKAPGAVVTASVKRLVDVVGASAGIMVLLPLFLVVALVVVLDRSGGPFFVQTRIGRHGRPFSIIKFRTMHVGADRRHEVLGGRNDADGLLFKLRRDPRVTPVGRLLRRYSIDELPQLWNVLRGDMSLVGPRPALPCEVGAYCDVAVRRLEVLPGVTGPWQVGGRSTLSWNEGLALDLHYVDHWSLRYDLVVLVKTVRAVVVPRGAY